MSAGESCNGTILSRQTVYIIFSGGSSRFQLCVRVRFLRARMTLGLNSPRMRIKREKEHGVLSWKITCLSSDLIYL